MYSQLMDDFTLYTAHEVAVIFGCFLDRVYRRASTHAWPHYRDGLQYHFSQKQVEEILMSIEVVAKPSLPKLRGQRGRIDALMRTVPSAQIDKAMARIE
ncbi:hypothetical protein AOC05_04825 [Arthrobacter alpinus]|uniref:DNA-binding protein n=1 Tax=Arthrobacter alpinus TaxID=656366 RepID=A0A0M4QVL5_9MICC|nr:hypothetical protein AOC05_04825 [Arthrobacter alpinus]